MGIVFMIVAGVIYFTVVPISIGISSYLLTKSLNNKAVLPTKKVFIIALYLLSGFIVGMCMATAISYCVYLILTGELILDW